jgi:hypothetical protein
MNRMATGMNSTRRFFVRLSLVTGSTLATIVGAQGLALFENQTPASQAVLPAAGSVTTEMAQVTKGSGQPLVIRSSGSLPGQFQTGIAGDAPVVRAAPSITILRRSGQTSAVNGSASANPQTAIQPPAPVTLADPNPIIVQSPGQTVIQQPPSSSNSTFYFPPVTRSSR